MTGYTQTDTRNESVTLSARPEALRLKPSETAVTVVDMQNAYAWEAAMSILPASTPPARLGRSPPGTSTADRAILPRHVGRWGRLCAGMLPFDKDNNVGHVGDAAAQTRHVLETIKSVIETAGGTMEGVTFNSIFIRD